MLGGIAAVNQVTTVVIHFQTPDLTERVVASFRRYYPNEKLLIIDNGSRDGSDIGLRQLQSRLPDVTELLFNKHNLHHGPAMDHALHRLQSPFVLFLDSDCEVRKGGFIELMQEQLEQRPEHYIIGKRIFMNKRGFDVSENLYGIPYIRPVCMLVKRDIYFTLPPFTRHGTPCLSNMKAAIERGLFLLHFPVEEYVDHKGRGTAGRFGYKLGWRGKWNYLLNKLGL